MPAIIYPVGANSPTTTTPALSYLLDGSQSDNVAAASTFIYNVVTTIAAGSYVQACVAGGAVGLSSVADARANTWTVDKTQTGTNTGAHTASSRITTQLTAGDAITFTYSANTNGHAAIVGTIANVNAGTVPDQTAGSSATTATPTATTGVTTLANEIVIGCFAANAVSTTTEDGNFTAIAQISYNTATRALHAGYRIVAATGAQTYAPTYGGSTSIAEAVTTYKGQ